jgi:hypothetical protein
MTFFKLTSADENAGLGESVGADLRAATGLRQPLRRSAAATLKIRIFIEAFPDVLQRYSKGKLSVYSLSPTMPD